MLKLQGTSRIQAAYVDVTCPDTCPQSHRISVSNSFFCSPTHHCEAASASSLTERALADTPAPPWSPLNPVQLQGSPNPSYGGASDPSFPLSSPLSWSLVLCSSHNGWCSWGSARGPLFTLHTMSV